MPERADKSGGVAGKGPAVVAARRLVAAAVSPQVHRDDAGVTQAAQLMSPRPPERAEPVQKNHQRPLDERLSGIVGLGVGFHHVEPNAVGVHLEMAPRTVDTDDRRVRWGHYQPDGSAVGSAAGFPSEAPNALALSWPGVSASGISLTVSMVFCGP